MTDRLPWLLGITLMVAGSSAAHLAGRVVAGSGELAHRHRDELAATHERMSGGFSGHVVMIIGLVAAIAVVAVVHSVARRLGSASRGFGAGCFAVLPPVAYSVQELAERLLSAESTPFHAALEPRFWIGLGLQIPFGVAAFLLGWALLRGGQRIVRYLRRGPLPVLRSQPVRLWTLTASFFSHTDALARGHPLRGPPLLA